MLWIKSPWKGICCTVIWEHGINGNILILCAVCTSALFAYWAPDCSCTAKHTWAYRVFSGAERCFVPEPLCSVGPGDVGHSASYQTSFHCWRCLVFKTLPFYSDISQFNACLDQCQKLLKKRSQDFTLCDTSATVQSPFFPAFKLCLHKMGFSPLPKITANRF